MAKFATRAPAQVHAPIKTVGRMLTHEGGLGWTRDAKSDLFLLAVTNMVKEDTFYEDAETRDTRFVDLVHQVTAEDPEWVAKLVPWLRDVAQMRSASLVIAAEYVKAGGPGGRQVVGAAIRRADEPAEMLGYWHQAHGRHEPMPLKRGVADVVVRLYDERAALRYDGQSRAWRFGDVIERVHPHPKAPWQSVLFKYLLDCRRHEATTTGLDTITKDRWLQGLAEAERRANLSAAIEAGWSWERLSGWLPGGMDAEAWETVISNMGYMALLRNLRNFDQAGVSDDAAFRVQAKLADPAEVAKSRQFPIRFLSAWREIGSLRWGYALERALEHSLANIPQFGGRTLVLVDLSSSMWSPLSGRSKRQRWEVALTFGAAVAKRAEQADLVVYGSDYRPIDYSRPLLKIVEQDGRSMGGTNTMQTLAATYMGHNRVVIVTDEQAHDAGINVTADMPFIHTFNVAGYAPAHLPSGQDRRYTFGGLTDACFQMIPMLEQAHEGQWPHLLSDR